jgi:ferredoxin-NADP reductase
MPAASVTTPVASIRDVAPEVRELTLAPPPEPLSYAPGQWLSLHLPVGEKPPLVRAYSFSAPASPSGELVLCLDRVPGGLGSEYLFGLREGDPVAFDPRPLGNFVLPPPDDSRELLWLARYTGIVPFRAMLLHLAKQPPRNRVALLYSAERPEELAYRAELVQAAAELSWFDLIVTVDAGTEGWNGRTGPVLELLPALVGERTDLLPMVCGKKEFVRPIRDFFYERGYERRGVKWENFD